MSANIYWLPITEGIAVNCSTPSAFRAAMEKAFGEPPWELDRSAIDTLRGMAAASHSEAGFGGLVDALCEYGRIRVWMQY